MSQRRNKVEIVATTYGHQGPVTNTKRARDIHNNATYETNYYDNVRPERKLRPIRFRYRPPVEDFVGREEELNFLKEKLCAENPRIMVVSGLGGIGKTQLAKKFFEDNKEFYRNLVWINSYRKESIEEEFRTLAESYLDIPVNVSDKEKDFRCILDLIFEKLSTAHTLLIFDNVDKIDDVEFIRDIVAVDVKPHILITSRIQEFSWSVDFRKLEVFSSEEAIEYISKNLNFEIENDNEPLADKKALTDILKNLPLALRQATGHIKHLRKRERDYKIGSYIADFNECREQILNSNLFQKDFLNDYKFTTLTTWKITMNAINEEPHGKLAIRILHIMAYFDQANIIREIFFNIEGLSIEPELKKSDVISAVDLIINYSMVDGYECQSILSIHKLVQEVIQIQLENDNQSEPNLRDGLQLISQMEGNEKFKVCLAHGTSVYLSALRFRELVIEFNIYPSMILRNLDKSGNYLRAFSFGNEINKQFTEIFGMNDRSTILLHSEIAKSYSNMGKYSEALQMYQDVLAKDTIIFGENHPETIGSLHNIAYSYSNLGEESKALQIYEKVLEKNRIVLGEDHANTVCAKHNIATSYSNLGKYSEALQMFEEVLKKRKIILGEDHPDTIRTKHNIAYSYRSLGKYSEALQMFIMILEKAKMILGEDHQDTISCKHNIANLYIYLGKYSEALQIHEEILEKRKSVLGDDHPYTILSMFDVANSYGLLGKHSEALQMDKEVLEKRKTILGENHQDTIRSMHNIATLYSQLGKESKALQMYEKALEKMKIVLGENHPDAISIKHNIAYSYCNQGKYSEGLQIYKEVLQKRTTIFGVDHPYTIRTEHSVANVYNALGKHSKALQMYEKVLEKRKNILGKDHPDTISTEHNIAFLYSQMGKNSEALQMYKAVLEKMKNILGENHPDTLLTKFNVADSYSNLGKHSVALQIYEEVLEKRRTILGENHPDTIGTKSKVADLNKK